MPRFQYIEFLSFLALIPIFIGLFLFTLARKKSIGKKIGEPLLVKQLTACYNPTAFAKKFILVMLAFGMLVLVLANLRKSQGEQKISRDGIDVMIALDVSKSMLAQDIKPTRLERAKQVLNRLTDKLMNDRIGIVIFAGKAYLQMPLTSDHSAAKMYLSAATTESVPTQGTVISDALKLCYASFNAKEKKYKAVVLISDGEDHDKNATKTAEEMAASGVSINTIGIGSPQGASIMDETTNELKKDNEGNTVISKLNEKTLRSIAAKANGRYLLFSNTDEAVSTITSQLNSMDERGVTDDSLVNYRSYFQYFLLAAFLLLMAEIFVSEKKKLKRNFDKLKPALTVMFIFACEFTFAQSEKRLIKKGNEAYTHKDFATASDAYMKALKKYPSSPVAQFNMGNVMYRTDKKEEAIKAYENAVKQLNIPAEKGNAYYNKGVVLQNNKKLSECIDAYKTALKLDPANEDARQNLQKALQQQKQQQQDQNKDQQKQQQQKKQEKQEPKPQSSKLTKEDAENKLKALMQQEKALQDKLHKVNNVSVNKPEKDW